MLHLIHAQGMTQLKAQITTVTSFLCGKRLNLKVFQCNLNSLDESMVNIWHSLLGTMGPFVFLLVFDLYLYLYFWTYGIHCLAQWDDARLPK